MKAHGINSNGIKAMPYCTAKKHDKDKGAGMKKELSKKEIENALSRFALDGEVRSVRDISMTPIS